MPTIDSYLSTAAARRRPPSDTDAYSAAQVLTTIGYPQQYSPRAQPPQHLSPTTAAPQTVGHSLGRPLPGIPAGSPSAVPTYMNGRPNGDTIVCGSLKESFGEVRNEKDNGDTTVVIGPVTQSCTPAVPVPTFKPEFQFVANEDAKQARRAIRKHVMREYRRRERWEYGDNKSAASGGTAKGTGLHKRKAKEEVVKTESSSSENRSLCAASPWILEPDGRGEELLGSVQDYVRRRKDERYGAAGAIKVSIEDEIPGAPEDYGLPFRGDPWAAVGQSQVNPFSRIPFDVGPATQALLHHFAWVMPSIMDDMVAGTNFKRLGWLYSRVAAHDPTPIHVILGFTLGNLAQMHGTKEPPLAIEHKQKALKLITDRVKDPVEAISDPSIGAVVNIAGYELIDKNGQGFATHMNGLARLIDQRGGMSTFKDNPDLEDVIVRMDVIRAYIALSSPRYPTYSIVRSLAPLALNVPRSYTGWSPIDLSTNDRKGIYWFCEDSMYLIHELEDFMLLVGSVAGDCTENLELSIQDLIMSAASQLLCRHDLGNADAPRRPRKCTRLAALIFMNLAIRELFDSPEISGRFVRELKARFFDNTTAWGRSLEMLTAVLVKHSRVALEKGWRAWYVADAVTTTMNFGDDAWVTAERNMLAYLWDDAVKAVPGPRSSCIWDLQTVYKGFLRAWD
ncbi:hypothetical protein MMC26_003528 [Xylographa opegraphella]|nr:hypothetical protein [Xylographa opegraphella]